MGHIPNSETPKPVRLLALDGGGVRGLSSLIILKHLMQQIDHENPPKPCEYFSLIGGTSTGGLIAIMLGRLCMNIDDCIEAYVNLSAKAFVPKRSKHNWLAKVTDKATLNAAYSSENLESTIKELVCKYTKNPDEPLRRGPGDTGTTTCKVFVCAVAASTNFLQLLRSYHQPSAVDSPWARCKIWEAARATSAAATIFKPMRIASQVFVDGATAANNPVEKVFEEAHTLWPDLEARLHCVVSIGTGIPELKPFGQDMIGVIKTLKRISLATEERAESFYTQCQNLGLQDRYLRLNVDNGMAGISLDEHTKADTIEMATVKYLSGYNVKTKLEAFVNLHPPPAIPSVTRAEMERLRDWLQVGRIPDGRVVPQESRTPGTGQWFLKEQLSFWHSQRKSVLWIHGAGGRGKSFLCSAILEQIGVRSLKDPILDFRFDFRSGYCQDYRSVLLSFVVQLCRWVPEVNRRSTRFFVPKRLIELCDTHTEGTALLRVQQIEELFFDLLVIVPASLIVLDALDECPSQRERQLTLELFLRLHRTLTPVRVLFTSQKLHDIEQVIRDRGQEAVMELSLDQGIMEQDIGLHIQHTLTRVYPFDGWHPSIRGEVHTFLLENAGSGFRWVDCQLLALKGLARESDVRSALAKLPRTLEETYARALNSLDEENYQKEAIAAFCWLAFARSPITKDHFDELLGFELTTCDDGPGLRPGAFNRSGLTLGVDQMRRIVPRLITVSATQRVHFEHFSVKQYLTSDKVPTQYRIDAAHGHRLLFESCIVCLQSFYNEDMDSLALEEVGDNSLLSYASWHWHDHAREMLTHQAETDASLALLASLFSNDWALYLLSLRVRVASKAAGVPYTSHTCHASPAWFLVREPAILQCLSTRLDIQALGLNELYNNRTPLQNAVLCRNTASIGLLLDLGADMEGRDSSGATALQFATRDSHSGTVIQLLLSHGAKINTLDSKGRTPFHTAAEWLNLDALAALADDVPTDHLNKADHQGYTAIHLAARNPGWPVERIARSCAKLAELGCDVHTRNLQTGETFEDAFRDCAIRHYERVLYVDISERPGVDKERHIERYQREVEGLTKGFLPDEMRGRLVDALSGLQPLEVVMQG